MASGPEGGVESEPSKALTVTPRIKLGELLVRAGVLDESKLKAALHEQERWGGRLGTALVAMGFLSEELLVKALSKQLAVPVARLDALDVPESVLRKLDHDFVKTHAICPERYIADRKTLVVAMADPINVETIDEVQRRTGMRIQPTVGGERAVNLAIGKLYGEAVAQVDVGTSDIMTESDRQLEANVEVARATTPPVSQGTQDLLLALEAAQLKQHKAIRVMAELLIERGVLPRDEYLARLSRRS